MDIYREEILDHWQNPHNFGKMRDADAVLEQINSICGDKVRFFFKFEKKENPKSEALNPKILDVSFVGEGCALSVASASIISEELKGKSVKELEKMKGEDILELIGGRGGFPPARLKCALLPLEAVKKLV